LKSDAVLATKLKGVPRFRTGKVRDVYDLGDKLLIVVTDRLSAFDVVLPDPIPDKGKVLNQLSAFWFERFQGIVANHMISVDVREFPTQLKPYRGILEGRAMLARKTQPLPVECVVRGFLAGSGWKDYQRTGAVCGIRLPGGLKEAARLDKPIFTPSTKAEAGHDENITGERFQELVGRYRAIQVEAVSVRIYEQAREFAESKGIIIADTKFEFGTYDDRLMLIDEVLTPDSSRFWDKSSYQPGSSPASFDKQFTRDYLERIQWNKRPPAPKLPPEVITGTRQRYLEAFQRLVGRELQ
jgi:phosphoribosylaminoimidazole-succinocarboxamide synthase